MDQAKPVPVDNLDVKPNNDEVICPACATQFRAIPVNVQSVLSDSNDKTTMLQELLDKANVPSFLPTGDGGTVALNEIGRVTLALTERKQLMDVATEANVEVATPQIVEARALLAETFKWLMVTDSTASLRQRIKLFLNKR